MTQIKTTGIVTRTTEYRDFDRMITILTPDMGRMDLCLKGCRKPNARLRAAGQMFCFADFELTSNRPGQYIMTGCNVRDSFFELAADVERMQAAGKLCRLVTMLYDAQQDAQRELFSLLLSAVTTLCYGQRIHADEIVLLCAIRMLDIVGYAPQTQVCVQCGAAIEDKELNFSAALGGALCPVCAAKDLAHTKLSAGAKSTLLIAQKLPNTKMATFHFASAVRAQLQSAVSSFLSHRFEEKISL